MPEKILGEAMKAFPSAKFVQGYGMTETSPLITLLGLVSTELCYYSSHTNVVLFQRGAPRPRFSGSRVRGEGGTSRPGCVCFVVNSPAKLSSTAD